ncbi:hypothetical protein BJX99DRAFT_258246 [Aspergillus californicus]
MILRWAAEALFWILLGSILWMGWIVSQLVNGWYFIRHPGGIVTSLRMRAGSPPVPLSRSRSLTLSSKQPQGDHSQAQSLFFVKLPSEIRQKVYRDILVAPNGLHPLAHDGTVVRRLPGEIPRGDKILPLLCSCRRIYLEAVSLLYEDNTFIFDGLQTIQILPQCITRRRLLSVRRLHLDVDAFLDRSVLPRVVSSWKSTCGVLAGMGGLVQLRIALRSVDTVDTKRAYPLASVLDPLRRVKVSSVIIEVPPSGDPESLLDGTDDLPFILVPNPGLVSRHYKCEWWHIPRSRLLPPPYWPDS